MTAKQKDAIKKLERAFKGCSKANVYFFGVDDRLKFGTKNVDDDENRVGDYAPFMKRSQLMENSDDFGDVNTHGTYLESGGF